MSINTQEVAELTRLSDALKSALHQDGWFKPGAQADIFHHEFDPCEAALEMIVSLVARRAEVRQAAIAYLIAYGKVDQS